MQRNHNNNVGHPACASCKHQRKKCAEDCVLAPYFPAERNREFQAVHKIFGVSNVMKLLKSVRDEDRRSLADSLVWEACCRQNDPILGPLGEYRKIQEELKLYKAQKQNQFFNQNSHNLGQHTMVYSNNKPGLISHDHGWINGNNGNYSSHDNGIIVDPSTFIYPINPISNSYGQGLDHKVIRKQEIKDCIVHSQPQQQQISSNGSINQQQYYLPGQFGSINGKTMENSLWEAGQ